MTFSENLNRICKERGTTITTLLKEMGLSTSKVTMWNSGSLPKQEVMLMLARKLGCSVMDFFADEDDLSERNALSGAVAPSAVVLDEDEKDIIRVFRELSNREKHLVMAQVYKTEETLHRKENR